VVDSNQPLSLHTPSQGFLTSARVQPNMRRGSGIEPVPRALPYPSTNDGKPR